MRIIPITVGAFRENAYVVVDEQRKLAVLVDPGAEPDRLIRAVQDTGARLEAIWLTHAHVDHIGAVAGVKRLWDVPVHLHPDDLPLYERGAVQAAAYGIQFEQPQRPDAALEEGQRISVGDLAFDVWHVPGHSPGHVAFIGHDVMIGGDLLFAGSIGRTDLPLSNPSHMTESLARLCELEPGTSVHPGHGPSTTIAAERATNPFLTDGASLIRR